MPATSYLRGHKIYWNDTEWRYCDNDEPTINEHDERPCGRCGLVTLDNGHDPCIANLPGVMNACCGHGEPGARPYVQFYDGACLRGDDAEQAITLLVRAELPEA